MSSYHQAQPYSSASNAPTASLSECLAYCVQSTIANCPPTPQSLACTNKRTSIHALAPLGYAHACPSLMPSIPSTGRVPGQPQACSSPPRWPVPHPAAGHAASTCPPSGSRHSGWNFPASLQRTQPDRYLRGGESISHDGLRTPSQQEGSSSASMSRAAAPQRRHLGTTSQIASESRPALQNYASQEATQRVPEEMTSFWREA